MAKARKAQPSDPFVGRWRITRMDQWEQEFVDAEVEGYVEFGPGGTGEFQFGYVQGGMHCRPGTRDGVPCVEWTWEGSDEMDPAHGRGWAVIKGGELHGLIALHGGDESGFVATKAAR